jgi:hypothetical protein
MVTRSRFVRLAPPPRPPGGTVLATADIHTRLDEVKAKTDEALRAVEGDRGASVVTVAVVREFDSKAEKAERTDDAGARDAVIELEQAADSARAAANADPGAAADTRELVEAAHLAICILKTEV